jgi:DNA replication protein DnaC
VSKGYTVQYVSTMELISTLARAHNQTAPESRLSQYGKSKLLITSNRPVMEWGEVFGDQVVATAILDRLLHHSHVLTVRGDSYRLREKLRSGLIKASSAVSTIPATVEEGSP